MWLTRSLQQGNGLVSKTPPLAGRCSRRLDAVFAADNRVPGTGSCSNYELCCAARGPVIQCVPYRLVASRSRRLSRAAARGRGPVTDPCLPAGHPLNLATSNRVVQPVMWWWLGINLMLPSPGREERSRKYFRNKLGLSENLRLLLTSL